MWVFVFLNQFSVCSANFHQSKTQDHCKRNSSFFSIFIWIYLISVSDHWLFSEDCSVKRFCSSPDGVMVCGSTDGQEVYAVTHDIVPAKGWVMQFKVNSRWWMHALHQSVICLGIASMMGCSHKLWLFVHADGWLCVLFVRLRLAAVCRRSLQRDRFTFSTLWTSVWPGSTWCLSVYLQILAVPDWCRSRLCSSRPTAGSEQFILYQTVSQTRETSQTLLCTWSWNQLLSSSNARVIGRTQQCVQTRE